MVTAQDLASWQPTRLSEVADALVTARSGLVGANDDLEDGAPPASWTTDDQPAAASAHGALVEALALPIAELAQVVAAIDTAAVGIGNAKNLLDGALTRARTHDLHVDLSTGAVSSTRTFTAAEEQERLTLQTVVDEVAAQIGDAVTAAAAADADLAAVLRTAATSDPTHALSLADIAAFQELSPQEQADYLMDHPELASELLPFVSDEVKHEVGERIAERLAGVGADPTTLSDPDTVSGLNALLTGFGGDPTVMAALYETLGPGGVVAATSAISGTLYVSPGLEGLDDLALGIRNGLATATTEPGFDGETFGRDLVRYAAPSGRGLLSDDELAAYEDAYPYAGGDGAAVLDFLLSDAPYSEDFVRGAVWELDAFERADPDAATSWYYHAGNSPLTQVGLTDGQVARGADPMAAALGQLGAHPELSLEFFTEDLGVCTVDVPDGNVGGQRSGYYFTERDWSTDGFEGVSKAVHGIGTNLESFGEDRAKAALLTSTFFDGIADNPDFTPENASAGSPYVADLLKHNMDSVEMASRAGTGIDGGPRVYSSTTEPFLPDLLDQPGLERDDLDKLLAVSASTDDGLARLAEGVAGYRQAQLISFAEQYPGDAATQHTVELGKIVNDSAYLEGFIGHAAGEVTIADAVSKDQQVAAFSSLVSKAVSLVPVPGAEIVGDVAGDAGTKVLNALWGEVKQLPGSAITEAFGSNADAARNAETDEAYLGRERMAIGTYLALAEAGIVPPPTGDWVGADGNPVSLADIPADQAAYYREEATNLLTSYVSETELDAAYRDPFLDFYR